MPWEDIEHGQTEAPNRLLIRFIRLAFIRSLTYRKAVDGRREVRRYTDICRTHSARQLAAAPGAWTLDPRDPCGAPSLLMHRSGQIGRRKRKEDPTEFDRFALACLLQSLKDSLLLPARYQKQFTILLFLTSHPFLSQAPSWTPTVWLPVPSTNSSYMIFFNIETHFSRGADSKRLRRAEGPKKERSCPF